jgi:hypothetical protein
MAVNLSPLGGVAAQFFDNAGNVLTGGKIYTYLAGTSTPAVTYTTFVGNVAHSNPIILDASGRVPSGEIWLTIGQSYKFIIKTSTEVLIGTYDNIVGITSKNSQQGTVTASEGQTIVFVPFTYTVGANSLLVFVNGSKQVITLNYTETNNTTVTFNNGLSVGDVVEFIQ